MPIDRHIHFSKLVVNPHPLLMAHGVCMFMYRGLTWQLGISWVESMGNK
jgi:hypothetical protein